MILFGKKPKFSIHYYGPSDFDVIFNKNLSLDDIPNIASFLYLLTYNSPITTDIINKIKDNPHKQNCVSTILDSWATIYLADINNPIIKPIDVFKSNVK